MSTTILPISWSAAAELSQLLRIKIYHPKGLVTKRNWVDCEWGLVQVLTIGIALKFKQGREEMVLNPSMCLKILLGVSPLKPRALIEKDRARTSATLESDFF